MASSYVVSGRPNSTVRLSCHRFYQLPETEVRLNVDEIRVNDEVQPIGWDRRYGMLFFSERALLYGPFSIPTAEDKFVFANMEGFLRDRGKKCIYRIFEAYTGVKLGKSGLRARPRDPATDRVYYFPSHYPNCIALSVLHFDGDSFGTCAALVYKFKSPDLAALAFKMLTETNSVPRRRRVSPLPPSASSHAQNTKQASSIRFGTIERNLIGRNSLKRSASRNVDLKNPPSWGESFIDFEGSRIKGNKSPVRLSRKDSKRRSKSFHRERKLSEVSPCRYCNQKRSHADGKTTTLGKGTLLIHCGRRYPLGLFHQIIDEMEEMIPFRFSKKSTSKLAISSSESSSDSNDIDGNNVDRNSNSTSSESVVELVFDRIRSSPKLNGTEITFRSPPPNRNGTKGDEENRNSTAVIRLSRQGNSDSEDDDQLDEEADEFRYLASPTKVIGDGTTVYNLYGRQRSEVGTTKLFHDSISTTDETQD